MPYISLHRWEELFLLTESRNTADEIRLFIRAHMQEFEGQSGQLGGISGTVMVSLKTPSTFTSNKRSVDPCLWDVTSDPLKLWCVLCNQDAAASVLARSFPRKINSRLNQLSWSWVTQVHKINPTSWTKSHFLRFVGQPSKAKFDFFSFFFWDLFFFFLFFSPC